MDTEPKNKGGRPFKATDEKLVQRSVRMSPVQWEKVDANGGQQWLRDLVDRSRPKTPPQKD